MTQQTVNITKRVKVNGCLRFCPVVFSANGRIKPDVVYANGKEERHPEGRYYLDWNVARKRRRSAAGSSASEALNKKLKKEAELSAIRQGVEIVPSKESKRRRIDKEIADYLEETRLSKKSKTFAAYTTALEYFKQSTKKVYLDELDRSDMLRFTAYLSSLSDKKKQSPRSIYNKFQNVMVFFKHIGLSLKVSKNDRPRFVEADVEVYEKEDLEKFFAVCNPEERLLFQFFLKTGMREQEVMYTKESNVHPKHAIVAMKWKPEFNWTPKAYKEREIPIPDDLLKLILDSHPKGLSNKRLLFSTSTGKPNFHFLELCKAIAKRAELDADDWWLHKFRATFATWHLRAGVDLRTVQSWMGHVDIESTMRYLKPARSESVREKVNATFS